MPPTYLVDPVLRDNEQVASVEDHMNEGVDAGAATSHSIRYKIISACVNCGACRPTQAICSPASSTRDRYNASPIIQPLAAQTDTSLRYSLRLLRCQWREVLIVAGALRDAYAPHVVRVGQGPLPLHPHKYRQRTLVMIRKTSTSRSNIITIVILILMTLPAP